MSRRVWCGVVKAAIISVIGMWTVNASAGSDTPLKIGVLGDYSSVYSSVGGTALLEAVKMAVEDEGGRALGKPIEVISGDSQLKPDVAAVMARRWFDRENVDVLVDIPATNVAYAVIPLANARKKVVLVTSAASSSLSGEKCSPYLAHWNYDTYSNANALGDVLFKEGGNKWFILNQDTATGTAVQKDLSDFVTKRGGKIVGSVRAPIDASDYSSFLLQAQASGANVVIITAAGSAGVTAVKQAYEFGLPQHGIRIASFFMMPDDVKALGLSTAQGLYFATAFVWDLNEKTKEFSDRFLKRTGKKPNMNMAATYSAVRHYISAVEAVGTKDADKVMAKMREVPVDDVFTSNGRLRTDGLMAHSTFVVKVKAPAASKGPWDLFDVVEEVPVDKAVRPVQAGGCPFAK